MPKKKKRTNVVNPEIETKNIIELTEQKNKRTARIIKCQKKDNFTRIYNACINDKNLSGEALAILVYVMSKPEDWIIYVNDLHIRFKRSFHKIYDLINELENLGYMKRYQPRDERGMVLPWVTEASDEPIFLKKLTGSSANDFPLIQLVENEESQETRAPSPLGTLPHAVNTACGEMHTTKKEETKKEETKKNNNNKRNNSCLDKSFPHHAKSKQMDIEPDGSVVVVSLMERIKHLAVSMTLVKSWLKKYGVDYVSEKIQLVETQKPNKPEGFLNKAIANDWKPALPNQSNTSQTKTNVIEYPTHNENVTWFNLLPDNEKSKCYQMALHKQWTFGEYLKDKKISVLDPNFTDNSFFKMLMSLIGRAL